MISIEWIILKVEFIGGIIHSLQYLCFTTLLHDLLVCIQVSSQSIEKPEQQRVIRFEQSVLFMKSDRIFNNSQNSE